MDADAAARRRLPSLHVACTDYVSAKLPSKHGSIFVLGLSIPQVSICWCVVQEYVDLSAADNYLLAAGASALVSSKAGRAAKVSTLGTVHLSANI